MTFLEETCEKYGLPKDSTIETLVRHLEGQKRVIVQADDMSILFLQDLLRNAPAPREPAESPYEWEEAYNLWWHDAQTKAGTEART